MKSLMLNAILAFIFTVGNVAVASTEGEATGGFAALSFGSIEYLHRWSKDDQHEFTPRGQENLGQWSDMLTVHRYRSVNSGESLAAMANAVLESYRRNNGIVVRTDSVPRTTEKPAEYLMVVVFPRPEFIEAVFARLKIVDGTGAAAIYSHREYGEKMRERMNAWLEANGPKTEDVLMSWEGFPVLDAPLK
jgi:hypothetical protein